MTRKDYELLAKVIRDFEYDRDCPDTRRQINALEFASALRADNPKFNLKVFLSACNVEYQDWMDK